MKKTRLDEFVLEKGYSDDLRESRAWIMDRKILVNNTIITKPGYPVPENAVITVRGKKLKYVSKGGYKLEAALRRFNLDVAGKTVLDAGASAGGFTDCLLQNGASLVYAVDVGFGVLKGKLRNNPKVIVHEKTNISDLSIDMLADPIDLCAADLSYLSIIKAIPEIEKLFVKSFSMICLIKPLFEGLSKEKYNDIESISGVLLKLFAELIEKGYSIINIIVSPIFGSKGTIDFLMYVEKGNSINSARQLVKIAVDDYYKNPPQNELV